MIWLVPAAFAILQAVLLLTCFNFETPLDLKTDNKHKELHALMKRCYKENEVKLRVEQIQSGELKDSVLESEVGYVESFRDPAIRGSAWVGFFLALIQ